jgi:hypothetical protein
VVSGEGPAAGWLLASDFVPSGPEAAVLGTLFFSWFDVSISRPAQRAEAPPPFAACPIHPPYQAVGSVPSRFMCTASIPSGTGSPDTHTPRHVDCGGHWLQEFPEMGFPEMGFPEMLRKTVDDACAQHHYHDAKRRGRRLSTLVVDRRISADLRTSWTRTPRQRE